MSAPDYLRAWARLPGPTKVLAEARMRAEGGRLGPRAHLDVALTPGERAEVGRMLAASWAASSEPVRVAVLSRALERHGVTLEELLVAVGGPLRDLRAERAEAGASRSLDRDRGRALLNELAPDGLDPAVIDRCLVGSASWIDRAEEVQRVIRHLDARGEDAPLRLGVLAASLFGDAHALDRSAGPGRAVARFAAGRSATPELPYTDPMGDARVWHEAWASVGVICDGVSPRVLVLNLPLVGDGPASRLCAVAGEPVWLTLRTLRRPFALASDVPEVFVCENPAVVEAAADAYGADSSPLVCTYGVPNLAATTLLAGIAPATKLRVRADGDAVGWSIASRLLAFPGAELWRMPNDLTAYEEEVLDYLLQDLGPN